MNNQIKGTSGHAHPLSFALSGIICCALTLTLQCEAHASTNQTERFRNFLDAKLTTSLSEQGFTNGKPSYSIVVTDDLNGDDVPDYIVFNKTAGFCGSGGCSYEIYVTKNNTFEEIDAPSLFGKSSVFVRQSHEAWKEIFTSDGGTNLGYPAYHRNVYDTAQKRYVEIESWFCGGLDFDVCTVPTLFCSVGDANVRVRDNASVFRAPYDESVTLAGSGSELASKPIRSPGEFNYIVGQTSDGRWFMSIYKFSGPLYVRKADVIGNPPLPRSPCELN